MIVFVLIVIIIIALSTFVEAIAKAQDRRGWVRGTDFNPELCGDIWIVARMIADPEKNEFQVKYNPKDNHFYDKENTGYHITEIYIKVEDNGKTKKIPNNS